MDGRECLPNVKRSKPNIVKHIAYKILSNLFDIRQTWHHGAEIASGTRHNLLFAMFEAYSVAESNQAQNMKYWNRNAFVFSVFNVLNLFQINDDDDDDDDEVGDGEDDNAVTVMDLSRSEALSNHFRAIKTVPSKWWLPSNQR